MEIIDMIEMIIQRVRQPSTLDMQQRQELRKKVILNVLLGNISQGQALRILRAEILGIKQADYAKAVGISRKTLSDIENDKGNYSVDILNAVFKPLGLEMGPIPINRALVQELFNMSSEYLFKR